MKKYYLTKYLIFADLEGSVILFNGFSGNMDVVSPEFAAKLRTTGPGGEISYLSPSELSFMEKRGHITVLPPAQEREAFRKLALEAHRKACSGSVKRGYLSLLMSYGCNLSCPYCYQTEARNRKGHARMSEEFLESVFSRHYEALFPGVAPKDLTIALYGGEPFLRANVPLIRCAARFSEKHGIRMSAISNTTDIGGVKEFLGPLPGMISNVQVTLDTSKEGRELPRSKGGRFPGIIENIHTMLDKKVQVTVRMHVSGDNYDELNEVVDYLIEQEVIGHPLGYAYLAPIREHSDPKVKDQCLDITGPAAREISRKLGHPLHLSAESVRALMSIRDGRLTKTTYCMLSRPAAHVIDPFHDIYGCYEEAGREDVRTGHIEEDKVVFFPMRATYDSRIVNNMEKCMDCPFALLCGGGCPYHGRRLHGSVLEPDCFDLKESLTESLKFVYLENKRSQQARFGV